MSEPVPVPRPVSVSSKLEPIPVPPNVVQNIIKVPSPVQEKPDHTEEEHTIFVATPSVKAFIGYMIWAGVWSIVAVVALLFTPFNKFLSIVSPPILIGGFTALQIWIETHTTEYKLTNERFFVKKGLIAKHLEELELFRVKDVSVTQGIIQRILGFGDVIILSTDDSSPRIIMRGISGPADLKEKIRTAYKIARKKENVRATEFIHS